MAKGFRYLLIASVCALACSCASLPRRQSAAMSKAFYAEQDALKAGRIDLAAKYGEQAARLMPPPAKRQPIKPVESGGTRYVILPPAFNGTPALAIGSPAFTTLASADKPLQRQFSAEDKAFEKTTAETDKVVSAEAKAVEKAETQALFASHTFRGRVKFYGSLALLVAGLIALCIFFPAAVPVLVAICRALTGALSAVVSFMGAIIRRLIALWKKPGGTP